MARELSITEARNQLLNLPETLHPGEEVEIYRHEKPVLKVVRTGPSGSQNPFSILDRALQELPLPKKHPPRKLAQRYKSYLYGKKG